MFASFLVVFGLVCLAVAGVSALVLSIPKKVIAAKILRRRRYSPRCPIAKRFASWAAREIGREGRERWNQERRMRAAFAWADKDAARRQAEYDAWKLAQTAPQTAPIASQTDEEVTAGVAARFDGLEAMVRDMFGDDVKIHRTPETLLIDDADDLFFRRPPSRRLVAAEAFLTLVAVHRNVAPSFQSLRH